MSAELKLVAELRLTSYSISRRDYRLFHLAIDSLHHLNQGQSPPLLTCQMTAPHRGQHFLLFHAENKYDTGLDKQKFSA